MLTGQPPFPEARRCKSCCSINRANRRTWPGIRPDVPDRSSTCSKRCSPSDRKTAFKTRPIAGGVIAVTEQLGVVYPQVSLPAGWSAPPAPADLVSPALALAGAGRAALAFGAGPGDRVASPAPEPAFQDLRLENASDSNGQPADDDAAETLALATKRNHLDRAMPPADWRTLTAAT